MLVRGIARRGVLIGLAGVVVAGAAAGAVVWLTRADENALPKELSVEALQAAADEPGQLRERIHEAFEREDLTEAQREQLRENIHQAIGAQMDRHMDEYFTASEADRPAVLDRHLDEMRTRMEQWRRDGGPRFARAGGPRPEGQGGGPRPGGQGERQAGPGPGPAVSGGPPPGGARAEGAGGQPPPDGPGRFRHGPPTRQERKDRSEARDPDRTARRMAYFTAIRKRAEERGIELPFGRGMGSPGGRR